MTLDLIYGKLVGLQYLLGTVFIMSYAAAKNKFLKSIGKQEYSKDTN